MSNAEQMSVLYSRKLQKPYMFDYLYVATTPGPYSLDQSCFKGIALAVSGGGKESADHDDVPAWPRLVPGAPAVH